MEQIQKIRKRRRMSVVFVFLVGTVLFCSLIEFIWFGYSVAWTGFGDYAPPNSDFVRAKTLWDWMDLLIIPLFLAAGAFFLNRSERESERLRAEERSILEREIETDRQLEATLQGYLDRMADLLLKDNLRQSKNEEVRNVARTRTLTVLQLLDAKRKGIVLLFLSESRLIDQKPVINLEGADFSNVELYEPNLTETNLSKANLFHASLYGAELSGAILSEADLVEANLTQANLIGAKLFDTMLSEANLNGADLAKAKLNHADLSQANLSRANLWSTDLTDTIIDGADLSGANLSEAKVSERQLSEAKSLEGATMPEGTLTGTSFVPLTRKKKRGRRN